VPDEIEEGFQAGIASSFCGLFCPLGDPVKKRKDLIWGYRAELPITELIVKMCEDELIRSDTIFFWNLPCGTQDNNSPLLILS
jgi:hypothetical protein